MTSGTNGKTQPANLPSIPFDGQIFIDAFRVKWEFDGSLKCWRKTGSVPEIPTATELQPGLLSANFKQLLNAIADRGGHFNIIAQPPSINTTRRPIRVDTVRSTVKVESGSILAGQDQQYSATEFRGKILLFTNGVLKNETFLIFDNDANTITVDGDITQAKAGDSFQIFNAMDFNPSGAILGNIELVSESIDIDCVDGDGNPIVVCEGKTAVLKPPDGVTPSALNFEVSDKFKQEFCVEIPGCPGPAGDKGDPGVDGKPGTGDGPKGEKGDSGLDAEGDPKRFSGITVNDVDDVFDSAVVALELDATAGKLNVVKAKMRVPDDESVADQVITSPIERSITFTDNEFGFTLNQPLNDPIGTADVQLLSYPQGFSPLAQSGENKPDSTPVNSIALSRLINAIVNLYRDRLQEASDEFDKQIREVIDARDSEARSILATLAQQLAECEWAMPMEYCIGIVPDECNPELNREQNMNILSMPGIANVPTISGNTVPTFTNLGQINPILSTILGPNFDQAISKVLIPELEVPANAGFGGAASVFVRFPDSSGSITLPAGGYVIEYLSGAIRGGGEWIVGSDEENVGLEAIVTEEGGSSSTFKLPSLDSLGVTVDDFDKDAIEQAYKDTSALGKTIAVELTTTGTIKLRAGVGNAGGGLSSTANFGPGEGCIVVKVIKADQLTEFTDPAVGT